MPFKSGVLKTNTPPFHGCTLQHYTSAITYDTMSLPNIWWTDSIHWKSMLFEGEAMLYVLGSGRDKHRLQKTRDNVS